MATHELSQILNMTDLKKYDPSDTIFHSVQRVSENSIKFNFRVKTISDDTKVFKLSPFDIWTNITEEPKLITYAGPMYVIRNETSNY